MGKEMEDSKQTQEIAIGAILKAQRERRKILISSGELTDEYNKFEEPTVVENAVMSMKDLVEIPIKRQ